LDESWLRFGASLGTVALAAGSAAYFLMR